MKPYIITLCIIAISSLSLKAQSLYETEVKTLEGESIPLSQVAEGQLLVLDFWTTWCKPCLNSIPKLIELSEKFDESQVQFIGVNEDSPRNLNKVQPMVKALNIPYSVILDTDQVLLNELMVNAFPTLMILNKEGELLYTHVGFSPGDEKALEEKIRELL